MRRPAEGVAAPPLARWDSGWYYRIAVEGYRYDSPSYQSSVGFYPLYPVLVGAIVRVFHTPIFGTGIALSLLCILGALFLIRDLSSLWDSRGDPDGTPEAILFFPTAFFFAAFYTESLFLLATAACLWGLRRGRWFVAGLGAAAAALTRLNGALTLIPIAIAAGAEASWRLRNIRARHVFACLLGVAGAAAYPAYLWRRFGSPLLYIHAKNNVLGVSQGFRPPWHLLRLVFKRGFELVTGLNMGHQIRSWLELGSLLAFSVLAVLLFRRRLIPEAGYCVASVLVFWCAGSFDAMDRYVLVLFPCFYLIGDLLRRRATAAFAYRFVGAALEALLLIRFVRGVWVG